MGDSGSVQEDVGHDERDRFLINLNGQGDTYYFFIERDAYEWATTWETPPPQRIVDALLEVERQIDPEFTEDEVKEQLKGSAGYWDNDRMLYLSMIPANTKYYSLKEFDQRTEHRNYIVDYYQGYIY